MKSHFIVFYMAITEDGCSAFGDRAVETEVGRFPSRKFIENIIKFGHRAEPISEGQITNILRVTEIEYNDYLTENV